MEIVQWLWRGVLILIQTWMRQLTLSCVSQNGLRLSPTPSSSVRGWLRLLCIWSLAYWVWSLILVRKLCPIALASLEHIGLSNMLESRIRLWSHSIPTKWDPSRRSFLPINILHILVWHGTSRLWGVLALCVRAVVVRLSLLLCVYYVHLWA